MAREVYIVTDTAHKKYAAYLKTLISQSDDAAETSPESDDDSLSAVVWTEKEYEQNRPEFTSENYVIFIGNGKTIKNETMGLPLKFQKYGMRYSILGKKAYLSVEKRLHSNLITPAKQKEFVAYCKERRDELNIVSVNTENAFLEQIDGFLSALGDTIFVQRLQYECLMRVFFLDALRSFIGE